MAPASSPSASLFRRSYISPVITGRAAVLRREWYHQAILDLPTTTYLASGADYYTIGPRPWAEGVGTRIGGRHGRQHVFLGSSVAYSGACSFFNGGGHVCVHVYHGELEKIDDQCRGCAVRRISPFVPWYRQCQRDEWHVSMS